MTDVAILLGSLAIAGAVLVLSARVRDAGSRHAMGVASLIGTLQGFASAGVRVIVCHCGGAPQLVKHEVRVVEPKEPWQGGGDGAS